MDEQDHQGQNGAEPEDGAGVWIDGQRYTLDDLTFEEQATYQKWMREDIAPPQTCKPCRGEGVIRFENTVELCPRCAGEGEIDVALERDYYVGLITVIKRRQDPTFSIEQARQVRPSELRREKQQVPPT